MDFFKSTYTEAEVEEEIRQRLAQYKKLDPLAQQIFYRNDEELVASVRASMPIGPPVVERPPRLSAAEEVAIDQKIDSMVHRSRIFGDRFDDTTGIPALDNFVAEKERGEFEKLVAPAVRERNSLEAMFNEAIEKAFGSFRKSSAPRRESDREGIVVRAANLADEEDGNSALAKFLRSYVNHDDAGMRRVARELAAEAA
jgi:hypothetical protein